MADTQGINSKSQRGGLDLWLIQHLRLKQKKKGVREASYGKLKMDKYHFVTSLLLGVLGCCLQTDEGVRFLVSDQLLSFCDKRGEGKYLKLCPILSK